MALIQALQGSKTHLLVLAAAILNAVIDQSSVTGVDAATALETIQLGMVSTFKAGVDRLLAKANV